MSSRDTLLLRALLLNTARTPETPSTLQQLDELVRHAPLYELPFGFKDIPRQAGQTHDEFRQEIVRWMEPNFMLPEGGAVLLGMPGTLYAVADLDTESRGVSVKRHLISVQAQDLSGQIWEGPFDVSRMQFAIACGYVRGPQLDEPSDEFQASVPLIMRVDAEEHTASTILDPTDPKDLREDQRVGLAIVAMMSDATVALVVLGQLQKSGTLEHYRVAPPPPRDTH